MQVISSKVLVDIPLFGAPTGKEKIIFQRKKDFSLESITLMFKKLFIGKQMKEAAVNRVQSWCTSSPIKESLKNDLVSNIVRKKAVTTSDVVDTFAVLTKDHRHALLLGNSNETNPFNLPNELNTLITNKLRSETRESLQKYNINKIFEINTLNDFLNLLSKANDKEDKDVNSNILNIFYPDINLNETRSLDDLRNLNTNTSKYLLNLVNKIRNQVNFSTDPYRRLIGLCANAIADKLKIIDTNLCNTNDIWTEWENLK